jgi:hypothetical protein
MKNAFTKWFDTFLEEKDLPFESFEVEANGMTHIMDTDVIIETIKNCNAKEQKGIKDMIVRIDFANGNVNHYFKHLGQGLANNYGS